MSKSLVHAKILIVDDHPMLREGMAMRISAEPGLDVCGEASSEDEAFEIIKATRPDLVVVDISLKSGNGIDLIKRVAAFDANIKLLVVSAFDESLYAERALRAGAMGYLNKQESNERIIEGIFALLKNERFVSAAITQRLVALAIGNRRDTQDPVQRLTDRELEVFRMIGQGLTSGMIADRLFVSSHTIDSHRENIKRKLGVQSAAELSFQAVHWVLENS